MIAALDISWGWAAVAGLLGGLAFLAVVYMGKGVRMTSMDFLYILGSMMLPLAPGGAIYLAGFVAHEMLAAGFGIAHAAILEAIGFSSVAEATLWDLLIGAAHGVVILVMMPLMLVVHPLVRRDEMPAPGVALTGFGAMTPFGSLMAHAAFGAVTGWLYATATLT